jgi:site-specific recombinase XerD
MSKEARKGALTGASRGKSLATLPCMKVCTTTRSCSRSTYKIDTKTELAVVQHEFMAYLRAQGLSELTKTYYRRQLTNLVTRAHRRGRCLREISDRPAGKRLLHECLRGLSPSTIHNYQSALNRWLKFIGHQSRWDRSMPWQTWIDDFIGFLRMHRGVGAGFLETAERNVRAFLSWKFGRHVAHWKSVRPADIRAFSIQHSRGIKPNSANVRLSHLRYFLSYLHLRGVCAAGLCQAVPHFAAYAQVRRPEVLSMRQRRELLDSFARRTAEGYRDYIMALCMIDLGLRASEVARLCCSDVCWKQRALNVPATKTGRGRELPLSKPLLSALRHYLRHERPLSHCDALFLRHAEQRGQPLTRTIVKLSMTRAYRRCGFSTHWSGTHRLRYTFASRLYRGGASLKEIGDLLGHQRLDTTNVYAQTDLSALRHLAQPWPVR